MILETKLNNLDNKPIKVNKKSPPMSINKDLTPFYFTAMFIGAKNSGKSYGLVKLLKFYENEPIKILIIIHYKLEQYYSVQPQIQLQIQYFNL